MTEQQEWVKKLGPGWVIVATTGLDGESKYWGEEWIVWSPRNMSNPEVYSDSWEGLKKKLKKFLPKERK